MWLQLLRVAAGIGVGLLGGEALAVTFDGRSNAVLTYVGLYGGAGACALLMVLATVAIERRKRGRDDPSPAGRLRSELRTGRRDGNALAGEAQSLDPVGDPGLVDDLVRRYDDYERGVADVLAATDLLDSRRQAEWLRPDQYAQIGPLTREELDQLAKVIAGRVRLIDGMLRELEGYR